MGKTPALGILGFCWVGLTLSGCAECCQSRAGGRKFQPAPLVQSRTPAASTDATATGFQATPKNQTVDATKGPPAISTAAAVEPQASAKQPANTIQQTSVTIPAADLPPPVPGSFQSTTRKTAPSTDSLLPDAPPAPLPPVPTMSNQRGTELPPVSAPTVHSVPSGRNSVVPAAAPSLAEEPPPLPKSINSSSALPPVPGAGLLPMSGNKAPSGPELDK